MAWLGDGAVEGSLAVSGMGGAVFCPPSLVMCVRMGCLGWCVQLHISLGAANRLCSRYEGEVAGALKAKADYTVRSKTAKVEISPRPINKWVMCLDGQHSGASHTQTGAQSLYCNKGICARYVQSPMPAAHHTTPPHPPSAPIGIPASLPSLL